MAADINSIRYPNPDWPSGSGVYCWDVLDASGSTKVVFRAVEIRSRWRQGITLDLSAKGRLRLDGGPWQNQGIDVWFNKQSEAHTVEIEPQVPGILRVKNGWLQEEYGVTVEDFSGTDYSGMKIVDETPARRTYHCNGEGGEDFSVFVFSLEVMG